MNFLSHNNLATGPTSYIHCDSTLVCHTGKLIRSDIICWDEHRKVKLAVGRGLYNIYNSPSVNFDKRVVDSVLRGASNFTPGADAIVWAMNNITQLKYHMLDSPSKRSTRLLNEVIATEQLRNQGSEQTTICGLRMEDFISRMEEGDGMYIKDVLQIKVLRANKNGTSTCAIPPQRLFIGNPLNQVFHGGGEPTSITLSLTISTMSTPLISLPFLSHMSVSIDFCLLFLFPVRYDMLSHYSSFSINVTDFHIVYIVQSTFTLDYYCYSYNTHHSQIVIRGIYVIHRYTAE